jgi:hypothetical protein
MGTIFLVFLLLIGAAFIFQIVNYWIHCEKEKFDKRGK